MKMSILKLLLSAEEKSEIKPESVKRQIVIAQRGWIFIGDVSFEGSNFKISNLLKRI